MDSNLPRRAVPPGRRGPISIGDLVFAIGALHPGDTETSAAIRALLHIEREPATLALPNIGAWKPMTSPPGGAAPSAPSSTPAATDRMTPDASAATGIDVRLTKTGNGPPPPPDWAALSHEAIQSAPRRAAPHPRLLFGPPRGRAILSTTLATIVDEGDVDLTLVVAQLAQGRHLRTLPRLPSLTLRRGLELLIDQGAGLDPFRLDAERLVESLDDILSDDRLHVASFAGCPSRGVGTGPRDEWVPWRAARPGTPLVVVTDLGISGPAVNADRADVGEWLRFAQLVRESGSELIALVPFEAGRWPPALARAMTMIHWSERTNVGAVRRARHESHARLK